MALYLQRIRYLLALVDCQSFEGILQGISAPSITSALSLLMESQNRNISMISRQLSCMLNGCTEVEAGVIES